MPVLTERPETDSTLVNQAEAHRAATRYVAEQLDPSFAVVAASERQTAGRTPRWRFFVRCAHGPLTVLSVDLLTGQVIPLTPDEVQVIREKAAILACRARGVLPLNERGYVLGEYARRRAERYLGDQLGLFFNAVDPVLINGHPVLWQVTIVFKMYELGPIPLGTMDVDAKTGEPMPLNSAQLQHLKARAHAIVEFQTQPSAAPV
jgi:hypothetical protein